MHTFPDTEVLVEILRTVAVTELLPRFAKIHEDKKSDGSLITEADLAAQDEIQNRLKQLSPEILFLGEEMDMDEQESLLLQEDNATWILDPLDGTTNFAAGIPYYAISLALLFNNEIIRGLVYDPERDECFIAEKGKGAWLIRAGIKEKIELEKHLNNTALKLAESVACIDLKRLSQKLATAIVSEHPFRSQRSFGGVALDWCWLAAGRFDIYLHGKQNIWDYAAGNLIFKEAGGSSSTLEGDPVFINQLKARVGVGAKSRALYHEWMSWLTDRM